MNIAENNHNTTRIAKNTIFLYFRMFIMMLIGLYTSRVILNVLGVEDYGTYNVVGGVVSMFSIFTTAMSSSISRFLTFELGKDNHETLEKVFSTALNVQFMVSIVIIVAIELIGVWFLNTQMEIPEGRMGAANWVLQCSAFTFVVGLLMVPYNASIIAHERMGIYAYVSIFDAIMKLAIVLALYYSPFDMLKSYAVLLLCVSTITTLIYWFYCKRHFKECTYKRVYDKQYLIKMTSFAGWSMVGDGAWILNTQGVNILINIFFGVTLNAARGIATTVDSMVQSFVRNFMVAINPQIIKSYAEGDFSYLHRLIYMGSKYSYFLILLFMIPICLETELILTLWLKIVPNYAVVFTRLTMASTMCVTLGNSLITANSATGQIRDYQLVAGFMSLSIFPLTWLAFALDFSPVSAYFIHFGVFFLLIFIRLYIVKDKLHMSAWNYVREVLLKALFVTVPSIVIPCTICFLQEDSFVRLIEVCLISIPVTLFFIYLIGMNNEERRYVIGVIKSKINTHF